MIALLIAEIVLTVLVIVGGAVVRATGSGAGCGEHWPLCNGVAIPLSPRLETVIEFSHRLTSGSSLLLFVVLYFMMRKRLSPTHPARAWANLALFSFFLEAGIGALLVLKKLVAGDTSYLRAVVIALHLVNTYVLLAALAGALWNLLGRSAVSPRQVLKRHGWLMAGWCLVGAVGAVVALGDTLFPAATLQHGLQQDFDPASHPLIRLRALHPLLAVVVSMVTLAAIYSGKPLGATARRVGNLVAGLILLQIGIGLANWLLLAPLWLQFTHLLVADVAWLAVSTFVLASAAENPNIG